MKRLIISCVALLLFAGVAGAQQQNYGCLTTGCNQQTGLTGFSGSITNNVLAKGTGATNTVAASTITDNGTTVSTTEPLVTSNVGDKALNVSAGGHISNPIGAGTPPTTGTGTVTAGGTDTASVVTGATSPVTVTFGTAFAVAPVCVCTDITSNHACSIGTVGTTSIAVTTTGTDSFDFICIGK